MDDLQELSTRVKTVCERLQEGAREDRQYGQRLDEIASTVESALSRFSGEMDRMRGTLNAAVAECHALRKENDAARIALIQASELANNLHAKIAQKDEQNETLRQLLLDVLTLIENNERPALARVLQRIEFSATTLIDQQNPVERADGEPTVVELASDGGAESMSDESTDGDPRRQVAGAL